MPVCTGGSQPIPGVATSLHIDVPYLRSLLPQNFQWVADFLNYMPSFDFDLATYCAVDPPGNPTLPSGPDFAAFLISPSRLGAGATVFDAISQWIHNYAWYQFCQCTVGATPAPPTTPTPPTGLPAVNPSGVVGVAASPTTTWSQVQTCPDTTRTATEMFTGGRYGQTGDPGPATYSRSIPVGATHVRLSGVASGATGFGNVRPELDWFNGTTLVSSSIALTVVSGTSSTSGYSTTTGLVAVPATANQVVWDFHAGAVCTMNSTVEWFTDTGNVLNPGAQQCCTSTSPVINGMLSAILEMVTLMQREATPFAYVSGTVHHSLTGSSTLSVQGILGVLLNVSGVSHYGSEFGVPDTYFRIGDIRFGTADGYSERVFIDTVDQVVLPPSAGVYTLIAYNLEPGVTLELTELIREP